MMNVMHHNFSLRLQSLLIESQNMSDVFWLTDCGELKVVPWGAKTQSTTNG